MRVLHVIDTLAGGGAEKAVCELLPRLSARGIEAAALAGSEVGLTDDARARLGVPILEGRKRGRLDAGYAARLVRLVRSYEPDIVHTHTFHGKYWGRFAAAAARVPAIVHTEHSSVTRIAWYERPFAAALAARTAAYVTFSQRTAHLIRTREPVPELIVIPNGIEIPPEPSGAQRAGARDVLGAGADEVVLGMVASLLANKNHALALDAMALLEPALRARTRLEIFGAGPEEAALRDRAARLGLAERVQFRGFRSDVRALLPALDLFLSLSFAESAPVSVLEAMANTVPVVGTPTIGVLDLVEDGATGVVLRDRSPAALAAALSDLAPDAQRRTAMGVAARRRVVAGYDIERAADLHVALYRRLSGAADYSTKFP